MVTFFVGFFAIALAVSLAICGMLYVRNKCDIVELRMNHDVADPMMSVVGTLFSILLGFLVAGSIQRFDEARMIVQEEAGAIADVFRSARGLRQPYHLDLEEKCIKYVDTLIDEEWKLMENKQSSPAAWKLYSEIWSICITYQPQTQGESNVHESILAAISRMGNFRTLRLAAMNNQLPLGMWLVVLAGGGATIAFTYFFEVKSERMQMLMTGLVSTVMALNIFILANYDYPFSGDIHVLPIAMELDRAIFHNVLEEDHKHINDVPALPKTK